LLFEGINPKLSLGLILLWVPFMFIRTFFSLDRPDQIYISGQDDYSRFLGELNLSIDYLTNNIGFDTLQAYVF